MIPWNLIVASIDGDDVAARAARTRLLDAWDEAPVLHAITMSMDDLEDADLANIDGVVLLATSTFDVARTLARLALGEESGVALLALVDEMPIATLPCLDGALVASSDTDMARTVAILCGLLHRQAEVRMLRREISIAHRFHGGLEGEIARMHEELQLAASVQREFLPRSIPSLHGVDFGALWRPAHYVSGDIYDISRLDHDHVGVFVADAVGHGVPAALMTMVIARSLTTKIIDDTSYRLLEPVEVLARLNHDIIRRQGESTRFATGVYALIDCRRRTMRVAGAGHPPPLQFGDDGSCRELSTSGGLLGIFEDESYDQIEVELAAGDRVLFHSDGFEQAFPQAALTDHDRRVPNAAYRDAFTAIAGEATPADMINAISHRLDTSQGSLHQVDDITLVCVQAAPLSPTPPRADAASERRSSQRSRSPG
jgi:serine phosphatase RsbU (regulator of sigma subunit)